MELDWITLYDYMSIFSRAPITMKINKFYESFYPLKFKKSGKKTFALQISQRVGFLGIVVSYVQRVLFALEVFLEAQQQIFIHKLSFLNTGQIKEEIKLSKMWIEIQKKNLQLTLGLQKFVYVINEASKTFNGKSDEKLNQKSFLEIKLICSLKRLFEFFYIFDAMKKNLSQEDGYDKVYESLKMFSYSVCQKSKNHIKLYPEMGQILIEILMFFYTEQKQPFNFHSHLMETGQGGKKTFPQKVKKLFAVIPNKQKTIFVNLSDENFSEYFNSFSNSSEFSMPKQVIQNYFRCQEEINSIIAEQENFIESILVPQIYRGKPEWKKKVMEQLVNLSVEKKVTKDSKLIKSRQFKLSDDFPLFVNN